MSSQTLFILVYEEEKKKVFRLFIYRVFGFIIVVDRFFLLRVFISFACLCLF